MSKLDELIRMADASECDMIELMLHCAADYICATIRKETAIRNIVGLKSNEAKSVVRLTDSACGTRMDALIATVNAVNSFCDAHGVPRIYTGSTERRAYGDYAMELVADIFTKHH